MMSSTVFLTRSRMRSACCGLLGDLRIEQDVLEAHDDHQFPLRLLRHGCGPSLADGLPRLILVRGSAEGSQGRGVTKTLKNPRGNWPPGCRGQVLYALARLPLAG